MKRKFAIRLIRPTFAAEIKNIVSLKPSSKERVTITMKKRINYPKPHLFTDEEIWKLSEQQMKLHAVSMMDYMEFECGVAADVIEQFLKTVLSIAACNLNSKN